MTSPVNHTAQRLYHSAGKLAAARMGGSADLAMSLANLAEHERPEWAAALYGNWADQLEARASERKAA